MECHQIEKLLPDYLQDALGADDSRVVAEHLRKCDACREDVELWHALAALPPQRPNPMLRRQVEAMLKAYQQGHVAGRQHAPSRFPGRSSWLWVFVPAAAALALLVIGFAIGRNRTNHDEIASLHRELASTRELVALSMLQQQSASDRLQGVSLSTRVDTADSRIKDALLHTLRFDSSVDVRLAALDALRAYTDQELVRNSIEESFRTQKSPLVQIALVDFMVEQHDRAAVEKLKSIRRIPDLNPTVRERVEWGITQLS